MASFDDDARRDVLRRWRESGLGSHEFARLCGVSHATLYKWRRELRPRFVEITPRDERDEEATRGVAADQASRDRIAPIEIALRDGVTVRVSAGFDAATLRAVVEALA